MCCLVSAAAIPPDAEALALWLSKNILNSVRALGFRVVGFRV